MTPVVPYSISNVSVFPGTAFTSRKTNSLTKFNFSRNSARHTLSPQSFLLPFSTSIRLFPLYNNRCPVHHSSRTYVVSATGTDVAVEQPDSATAEASTEALDNSSDAAETIEKSSSSDASSVPSQARRARPGRQSEMSPVKNEELVPGATFTGKVRSIQPFGAFIDFGAFTDGLVHVSQLSDTYVKDVGSVVSVGQEVKVTLVEANMETKRISLTMREGKDASSSSDRGGSDRRGGPKKGERKNEGRKSSKFAKGQDLVGTVKNLVRAGAFISLPEGEEGFLPQSEEADDGFASMMGETSLEIGQEINVRVLRISRGQVTLTMKKEEDLPKSESQITQGVIHTATNPFLLAFRQNKDVAAFLDEREKTTKETATPKSTEESTQEVLDKQVNSDVQTLDVPSAVDESIENDGAPLEVADVGASESIENDGAPLEVAAETTVAEIADTNPAAEDMDLETAPAQNIDEAQNGDATAKRAREEEEAEESGGDGAAKKAKVEEKSAEEQRLEKLGEGENGAGRVSLGPKSFGSAVEMFDYFYKLLHYWPTDLNINKYEYLVLLDLLKKGHSEPDKKIGGGIQAFQVRFHPLYRSRCYFLVREDGASDDFSFRKCVDHILPLPENMKAHGDANKALGGGKGGGGRGSWRGRGRGRGRN